MTSTEPASYWPLPGLIVGATVYVVATGVNVADATSELTPSRTAIAFTTVHEIGKAIHPLLAVGQIEGGSAQGLGYALLGSSRQLAFAVEERGARMQRDGCGRRSIEID